MCPISGDSTPVVAVDPRLVVAPELIEIGLLMPARLARMGFEDKSRSLYEAVKMLTGLDQLADIAEGCGQITHRGRRFLKYGRDNGLEAQEGRFNEEMTRAVEKAGELQFEFPNHLRLGNDGLVTDLTKAADRASTGAGARLETLRGRIDRTIDIATTNGRKAVSEAVGMARAIVKRGGKISELFDAWTALTKATEHSELTNLPGAVGEARARLERALTWHARQAADRKFRLKALAADFFVPPHDHLDFSSCPLCSALLSTPDQRGLAAELAELQKDASEAERKLDDVCREIEAEILGYLPADLKQRRKLLGTMDPRRTYATIVREQFSDEEPFSNMLVSLAGWTQLSVEEQQRTLPEFTFGVFVAAD